MQALLEGHALQSPGEGSLLACPTRRAPEGLRRAVEALLPASDQAVGEPPQEEPASLLDCDLDLDMDLEVGADKDNEYLLS